ncbi:MATE family efflux transporter [Pectobacterium atrosepticum]|uniref:MATE family efflux transporter n=1 Tax=Pectobacterium atrosepticum TaxID=29471 RepID=UPI00191E811B|nr:MATE family efflux transporter [Pectobacterium atrosepticum]MBL0894917.1 MATE family efflux transporter [Pectobacterium atrosepticum]
MINAKSILITTLFSWLSRIIIIAAQLISIRILLKHSSLDEFAAYSLLVSIGGWFILMDFGIAIALQNYISERLANKERYQDLISKAMYFIIPWYAVLVAILYLFSTNIASFLLPFSNVSIDVKADMIFITGLIFATTGIGNVCYKIWYAENKGYISNILPAIGAIIGFFLLYLFIDRMENKSLGGIMLFYSPTALISLFALLKKTAPCISLPRFELSLVVRGSKFWVLSIMVALTLQVDYVIMSRFLSAEDIVIYTLTTRIFGFGYFLYSSVLAATWPTFTELSVKKDAEKILSILKKYVFFSLLGVVIFTFIFILTKDIVVSIFTSGSGKVITIPNSFILLNGTYQLVLIWTALFSTILQSVNLVRLFLILTPIQAAISASLQWVLAENIGLYGITIGLLVSYLAIAVWLLPIKCIKYIKSLDKNEDEKDISGHTKLQ